MFHRTGQEIVSLRGSLWKIKKETLEKLCLREGCFHKMTPRENGGVGLDSCFYRIDKLEKFVLMRTGSAGTFFLTDRGDQGGPKILGYTEKDLSLEGG